MKLNFSAIKKLNFKKGIMPGLLAVSVCLTGYIGMQNVRLVNENEELKFTEGGTASTEWNRKSIDEFLGKASYILEGVKKSYPDWVEVETKLVGLKTAYLDIKTKKLPREYDDALYFVLSAADSIVSTGTAGLSYDSLLNILSDRIDEVKKIEKEIIE